MISNRQNNNNHKTQIDMKLNKIITLIVALVMGCGSAFAQYGNETPEEYNARMQWFGDAKFGVFIHWGIYATDGYSASWSFYNNNVAYDKYMQQAKRFKAAKYDPVAWAKLIKESGASYTVITTKHHDGVALWDTKAGKLSTKKITAAKRDVLTPFVNAVRKEGLKVGLYFSLLDWSHPDYPNHSSTVVRYKPQDDPARWDKFCKFNFAQLSELSKTYNPDLYWFDGDWEQDAETWRSKEIVDLLRSYNKNVIVNSRITGYGDYATPERGVPVVRPKDKFWELCMTMNETWGYTPRDTYYKSPYILLRTFVDCLSNGGNLLLNIGPKEDGTIPAEDTAILKEFGRWINKHKEAVYGTRAGIPSEHFQGYTTLSKDGTVLYLYLPYRPQGKIEVKGLANQVHAAWVVGRGVSLNYQLYNKAYWSAVPGNLYIDVPDFALDPQITVIGLLLDGPAKLYRGEGQVIEAN